MTDAMIDGCSRVGTFLRIALPLALPGVIAASPPMVIIRLVLERCIVKGLTAGAVRA